MTRDRAMRRVLWAATGFNLVGALLFAFPGSMPGQLAGLPPDVPLTYRAFVALFVVLFAGAYAWLAARTPLDRPMVAFAAIGKTSAVALVFLLWLASEASFRSVLAVSGDLVFAAFFVWWLLG